jgi:hypothetical protein
MDRARNPAGRAQDYLQRAARAGAIRAKKSRRKKIKNPQRRQLVKNGKKQ